MKEYSLLDKERTLEELQYDSVRNEDQRRFDSNSVETLAKSMMKADKYHSIKWFLSILFDNSFSISENNKKIEAKDYYIGHKFLAPKCDCGCENVSFLGLQSDKLPLFNCEQCGTTRIIKEVKL